MLEVVADLVGAAEVEQKGQRIHVTGTGNNNGCLGGRQGNNNCQKGTQFGKIE